MNSTKMTLFGVVLTLTSTTFLACTSSNDTALNGFVQKQEEPVRSLIVRSDYEANEITRLCDVVIKDTETRINLIAQQSMAAQKVQTAFLAFEDAMADFSENTGSLTFMGYVSRNPDISAEGSECEAKVGQFYVDIFTRRDLYNAIKSSTARDAEETRLLAKTLEAFDKNGLKLNDEDLATLKGLLGALSEKQTKFSTNLNTDTSTVEFTAAELSGVSETFLGRLKKADSGKFIVTTKSTDYTEVMENAALGETRQKLMLAYLNRGTSENTKLLEEATGLRAQAAKLLGYETWADYQVDGRMAGSKTAVLEFLNGLKTKLAQKNRADLDQLLVFKKELDPSATQLNQWDVSYLSAQLKKRDYSVDEQKIREYLPAEVVIDGMFKVYSQILGVTYHQVPNAKIWSPDVQLYEIRDTKSNRRVGYFYTDFIPREGKYGHAAAFTLVSGRMVNGTYNEPVSAIVANFSPPSEGKPSLLLHDEVETLFHEFGHIMHQTLTRARFASLSGSSSARDFVEAPSQMLENWVWSPEILTLISGHYLDHSQKLPESMLKQMLAARNFGQGIAYTKQLLYALFDMKIHTGTTSVDVTKSYDDLYVEVIGEEPIAGGHFAQTFGHMMGGYDAGYYGYLWSKVYAQDMFSVFQAEGLLSPIVGAKYRQTILGRGDMKDSIVNLKEFLGRDPSPEPFFKDLGI